ncbi:CheY-like chemotaxis protein [Neorhizobium galegae]|uniref:response regulator n=1 Tax=Neorhizobium galegae TaxID=399 RepID=UPI001AE89A86|nr:response regulator [Neorhizobium galegae]MBP2547851.1 CheY-like chemotaxis protein [Neorhizobium galegae]
MTGPGQTEGLAASLMMDMVADAISGAVLIYDRDDMIVFASPQVLSFLPALSVAPAPGTRLRDLLGAIYDGGGYSGDLSGGVEHRCIRREDWISGEIAALWRERCETVVRRDGDRWMSLSRRRLPSGHGTCVIRDVSELRRREDQWRTDLERVQLTEEILDTLPFPVIVRDRHLVCVAVNKAAERLYGRPVDEILGRRADELHASEPSVHIDATNRKVLETGVPFSIGVQIIPPDEPPSCYLLRKFRVGKPGRYCVVTVLEDVADVLASGGQPEWNFAGLEGVDFIVSDLGRQRREEQGPQGVTAASIAGCRVLLVTDDRAVEEEGVSLLLAAGFDATAARNGRELAALLAVVRDRQVSVDLIVVDAAMDFACLEAAQASGIDVLVLEAFQIARELVPSVKRRFRQPRAAKAEPEDQWQISTATPADVLVAEDNAVNQIVFSQILEGLGYRYAIASDGQEAVRLFRELQPRIVLMDITLPRLNGFEAASAIRELETVPGTVPIIGVLSPAVEGDRHACWAAGMDDVVMKPLSPDLLEETFRRHLADDGAERRHRDGVRLAQREYR